MVHSPPTTAGASSDTATHSGNSRRDPDDVRVLHQVGRVLALRGLLAVEHPAHVGVDQALDQGRDVLAVAPRRVRVAVAVGELVVLAVVGDPADDRALDREAAGDGQRDLDPAVGLEGLVREEPVEAGGDAEPGDHVHDHGDDDIAPAQPAAPGQRHRGDHGEEGDQDEHCQRDALTAGQVRRLGALLTAAVGRAGGAGGASSTAGAVVGGGICGPHRRMGGWGPGLGRHRSALPTTP